ncbi:MAG: lysine N(6)-hydroxylase/L-ornithine N(5)-oxygenase family protein [Acidimicrobiia bacterium]
MLASRHPEHDVVGVGFGASNLGLAVAIEEHNRQSVPGKVQPLDALFLERQAAFGWHRGMLFENATVQVSFLKDLATMRNPASEFSFVAYLHERGRLADFINHKTLFPLRVEFDDYFAWAAARLEHHVAYGREVTEVRPFIEDDVVTAFDVTVGRPTKQVEVHRARNVVIATGLVPHLPDGVSTTPRLWHNFDLLHRLETDVPETSASPGAPRRFVVVGSGQSAAETTHYLAQRYPDAEVCAVFSRFGYAPADDTSFANRIFDPAAVDTFYSAPEDVKQMLSAYHRNTNYGVVDTELIDALYRRCYMEKVIGRTRLRVLNASRVLDVEERADGVTVMVEYLPDGRLTRLEAAVVVYATGYKPSDPLRVLGRTGRLCRRDGAGRLSISRDYRLDLTVPSRAGLFVTGASEHAHGLSTTLLSNIAVRSGEILESIRAGVATISELDLDRSLRLAATQPSAREAS